MLKQTQCLSLFLLVYLVTVPCVGQETTTEILAFRNFEAKIFNFVSEGRYYERNYMDDEARSKVRIQLDTISIAENPCDGDGWYISGKTLKIIPKVKTDSFAVSITYEIRLYEGFTESWKYGDNKLKDWFYYPGYEYRKPVKKNQFKIQASQSYAVRVNKAIKQKYHLRDTSATYLHEGGATNYEYTNKGKLFAANWDNLYVRIQRFVAGKLKETNYIRVRLSDGCD